MAHGIVTHRLTWKIRSHRTAGLPSGAGGRRASRLSELQHFNQKVYVRGPGDVSTSPPPRTEPEGGCAARTPLGRLQLHRSPALPCEAHQRTVRKDPGRRELRQQGTSTPQPSRSDSAAELLSPSNPRSLCVISPLVCVMSLVGVRIRKMRGYLATSSAIRRCRDYCEVLTSPADDTAKMAVRRRCRHHLRLPAMIECCTQTSRVKTS